MNARELRQYRELRKTLEFVRDECIKRDRKMNATWLFGDATAVRVVQHALKATPARSAPYTDGVVLCKCGRKLTTKDRICPRCRRRNAYYKCLQQAMPARKGRNGH